MQEELWNQIDTIMHDKDIEKLNTLYENAVSEGKWKEAHDYLYVKIRWIYKETEAEFQKQEAAYNEVISNNQKTIAEYEERVTRLTKGRELAEKALRSGEKVVTSGNKLIEEYRESNKHYEMQVRLYKIIQSEILEIIAKNILVIDNHEERIIKYNEWSKFAKELQLLIGKHTTNAEFKIALEELRQTYPDLLI